MLFFRDSKKHVRMRVESMMRGDACDHARACSWISVHAPFARFAHLYSIYTCHQIHSMAAPPTLIFRPRRIASEVAGVAAMPGILRKRLINDRFALAMSPEGVERDRIDRLF